MLSSAHSKPCSPSLSAGFLLIISRLTGRSPSTASHLIMSTISNHFNFSISATVPRTCSPTRSHCNWRTGQVYTAILYRNVMIHSEFSRAAPSRSREGFSASNIDWLSCKLCNRCSNRQKSSFEGEHIPITFTQGLLNRSTLNPNCKTSWDSQICRSSSVSRVGGDSVRTRGGFESLRKFHTASRQEGRYISASAQEEHFRFEALEENGVEIEHEIGSDRGRGVELVGSNAGEVEKQSCAQEIWVVNFYYFVSIEDPHLEVARHTSVLEGKDVRGRIYISHQGVNAQLSGPGKEAIKYAEWVKEDSRFSDMLVQISPSPEGHVFPRLRLRYKPSLVQVKGGTLHLPITDPSSRAVHLSPREWTERLDAATVLGNNSAAISQELGSLEDGQHDDPRKARKPVVLLDVRNGYEWDVGHFKGAQRPNVDCFKSTEFGLTENEAVRSDPLANVDKEAVDVMMYCTGGIRCDVFSTMLRQKGFKNLFTLKGGVSNYLKEEGAARKWAGNLFVFDSRLAVLPKDYHMEESSNEEVLSGSNTTEEMGANSSATHAFARCRSCGDSISEPRHRNCANLDCNLFYLSCEDCLSQLKGCCSTSCSLAPRLRPLLARHQYDRWHVYRAQEPKPSKAADYVSRRALKRRRRKERRKLLIRETGMNHEQLESLVSLTEGHDKESNFATISAAAVGESDPIKRLT